MPQTLKQAKLIYSDRQNTTKSDERRCFGRRIRSTYIDQTDRLGQSVYVAALALCPHVPIQFDHGVVASLTRMWVLILQGHQGLIHQGATSHGPDPSSSSRGAS